MAHMYLCPKGKKRCLHCKGGDGKTILCYYYVHKGMAENPDPVANLKWCPE